VVLYLVLVIAGVFSIYAASYDFDHASIFSFDEFSGKQIRWIGLSLALAVTLLFFDARLYEAYAFPIYFILLAILLVTIFVAPDIKGSRSWLVFGPMSFQPAEFGKFATALALARLFGGYNFSLNASRSNYVKALAIIFIPVMLILAQNETGSALAYMALFLVLYREGMSGMILLSALAAVVIFVVAIKYSASTFMDIPSGEAIVFILLMILMVVLLSAYCKHSVAARNVFLWFSGTALLTWILHVCGIDIPGLAYFLPVIAVAGIYCILVSFRNKVRRVLITVIGIFTAMAFLFSVNMAFSVLREHQQKRIRVTLGMEDDLLGTGYNVNQAKIAIGSGGFSGKGFLNGTQTKLKYVPEQHTDFIFCTIGEEQGFLGSTAVLLIFLALILRVLHISERQPSTFGRVYGYCVASFFLFHLAINIGMVIGLCPVIGIPLPFFSYGGSSLWSFTILLFILLRIDASRRSHPAYF